MEEHKQPSAPLKRQLTSKSDAPYSIFSHQAKWALVLLVATAGLFR